jgi:hypothetical protein
MKSKLSGIDKWFAWCSELFVLLFLPLFILFETWLRKRVREARINSKKKYTWLADLVYGYGWPSLFVTAHLWQFLTDHMKLRIGTFTWNRPNIAAWSTVSLVNSSQVSTLVSAHYRDPGKKNRASAKMKEFHCKYRNIFACGACMLWWNLAHSETQRISQHCKVQMC